MRAISQRLRKLERAAARLLTGDCPLCRGVGAVVFGPMFGGPVPSPKGCAVCGRLILVVYTNQVRMPLPFGSGAERGSDQYEGACSDDD
jgi:hypothetical protein